MLAVPFAYSQSGNKVFGFLDLPVSTRANALGGINISIVERDLSMANMNPALLGPEMSNLVNMNFMHYADDINYGTVTYAKAFNENGAWAVGATFLDYGKFKHTTESNEILGEFGAKDMLFNGIVGYDLTDRWRIGGNAKFIYSVYESYNSIALAVDLGINYYNPDKDFSLALTANNLGGQLKAFDEKRESLPFDLRLGLSQSLAHAPFRFSVTAINLTNWKTDYVDNVVSVDADGDKKKSNFAKDFFRHIVIGAEYLPSDNFYIALGYNYKRRTDFTDGGGFLTGFSAGTGIRIKRFDVNASFAKLHRSGLAFMLGLNINLNSLR